jgi:hypothetical protein
MPYNAGQWLRRHHARVDISSVLTHLTKRTEIDGKHLSAVDVLLKILAEKEIKGSTTDKGFIVGDRPAVCFQDAPLLALAQNIAFEAEHHDKLGNKIR